MKKIGPLKISDEAHGLYDRIRAEGGDAEAFAAVMLEIATQMLRHGHLRWTGEEMECRTDRGTVSITVKHLK